MGETVATNAALEVSVSFGRFENDSLSWEKWSSFSPNKYLEEVEKCATPGSVAEKKAYFEAHYRKIAARKAELMELQKQAEAELFRSESNQGRGDRTGDGPEADYEIDASAGLNSDQRREQVDFGRRMERVDFDRGMEQEMEPNEDDLITIECHSFSLEPERVQEEPRKSEARPSVDIPKEVDVVKEVQEQDPNPTITDLAAPATTAESQNQPQDEAGECSENANNEMSSKASPQEENARLNQSRNVKKIIKVSKEGNTPTTRKKPASPSSKSPQFTTPKVSKPISASSATSASRSSTRARTPLSIPRSKNLNPPYTDGSKKVAPKSLHASVRPGPVSSQLSDPSTARKSFIMDSMGDKDIVRRAFKMFQNDVGRLDHAGDDKSPTSRQVSSKRTELRASHSIVTRQENGGVRSRTVTQRGPGAAAPLGGLRSSGKPRDVPQHVKKLQEKPNAKGRDKTNLRLKPKEDKEAESKTMKGCNYKPAPLPASEQQSKMKYKPGTGN